MDATTERLVDFALSSDFDDLPFGHRKLGHPGIHVDMAKPDGVQRLSGKPAHPGPVDHPETDRQIRQIDVFSHRQAGNQTEFLKDRVYTGPLGLDGPGKGDGLAAEPYRPGRGPVGPRQDFHDGRFSGPILAQKPMDLAGVDVHIHAGERL